MKSMKKNLINNAAKTCMNIGETAVDSLSMFYIWYEPKINSKLIKKDRK
ncbi:MAG: cyclic lactone autoinducer peptide [Clostridium sp.]|nr:cyclic lactone autoinducer peptide [Clostridium sp.]